MDKYIEQIKWERDLAIRQLKDLGYGLGEKPRTDDAVSRQAALNAIKKCYDGVSDPFTAGAVCYDSIKALPSVQPEIIRCKDCKHWSIHKRLNIPWCREMHIDRGAEDFCSMAERRADD